VVDLRWRAGRWSFARIRSTVGGPCAVRASRPFLVEREGEASTPRTLGEGIWEFDTEPGEILFLAPLD